MDFDEMCNKEDVNESYNPTLVKTISKEEYLSIHPFPYGSTLILEKINETIMKVDNKEKFINDRINELSKIYNKILRKNEKMVITVNNIRLEPTIDLLALEESKPFNQFIVKL